MFKTRKRKKRKQKTDLLDLEDLGIHNYIGLLHGISYYT